MQQTNRPTNCQGGEQNTSQVAMADACAAKRCATAAFEAHAALVLTDYHEYIPATVRNAIDWLTRRRNHSALQDKPLAVIGLRDDCYSGAWARHHTEEYGHITETLVIE